MNNFQSVVNALQLSNHLNHVDWELLNEQRLVLCELSSTTSLTAEQQKALDGVLDLLACMCLTQKTR